MMTECEIKGEIVLPEHNFVLLRDFFPDDRTCFCIEVELSVGDTRSQKADLYRMSVCSPTWLQKLVETNTKGVFLRGVLLVDNFDPLKIEGRVKDLVRTISGQDWQECHKKLSSYFRWEFVD